MKKIEGLKPFGRFIMTIGQLPASYLVSMTYEEQLIWLCNYLQNTVIPAVNNNGEAVEELQNLFIELKSYVDNYFENLDIQEEINNKLDEMAESGELAEIIAQFLSVGVLFTYDTATDLGNADNVSDGSDCYILGKDTYNDGKGAFYKIREIRITDVIDGDNIIAITNSEDLVAEKLPNYFINEINEDIGEINSALGEIETKISQIEVIYDTVNDLVSDTSLIAGKNVKTLGFYSINDGGGAFYKVREITEADTPNELSLITINEELVAEVVLDDVMNLKQFGAKGNGTDNDTASLGVALSLCNNIEITDGTYLIDQTIITKACKLFGNGTIIQNSATGFKLNHSDITIDGLTFNGNDKTYTLEVNANNVTVRNCTFVGEIGNYLRTNNYSYITYENNLFDGTNVTGKLITPVIFLGTKNSKIINSKFINVKGFNVQTLLDAKNILIEGNVFKNTITKYNQTASGGQTAFTFNTDGKHYARTGIKVNNTFNGNFTISETTTGYSVTFTVALTNGDTVSLYGCDSLECVNINSNSYGIIVNNNMIDGTGDSGVVIGSDYHNGILNPSGTTEADYPNDITVTNNYIKNCFYSGIAETHAAKNVLMQGNTIEATAIAVTNMYDEYDSCIRVSGDSNIVNSNLLKRNSDDVQRFGIIFRNSSQDERTKIVISNNTYNGNFENRKTSFSGATTAVVFGGVRDYEDPEELYGRCNINDSWSTKPANDSYFAYNNYGSGVSRNTTEGLIDTAPCIATIGSAYLDIYPSYPFFRNKILNIDFDCKAGNTLAQSYFKIMYKSQSTLPYQEVEYRPTNTEWHHHRIQIVLDGCSTMLGRIGADSGASASSYFQNIVFTVQNYK